MNVQLNGQPFVAGIAAVRTMGELVELIKTTIDPETIITSIQIDGRELSDNDWRVPLSGHSGQQLSINTGSRRAYVMERLAQAPLMIDDIAKQFNRVKEEFHSGASVKGNSNLLSAVKDLKAFIDWYSTLLQMLGDANEQQRFNNSVKALTDVCEQLLQQQLYRAWWAMGETIEQKLKPALEAWKGSVVQIYNAAEKQG